MSAAGIRAGKAFVEVGTDLNPLEASLKTIASKFDAFGARIGGIGKGFAAVGAGAAALGTSILAPIAAATLKFADFGSTLKDTSDRTGISASVLSELGYAAEQSGTDLATVEKSVSKLQKGITGAVGGSKKMSEAFDSIGLSANKLAALSPQRQFEEVAAAIGKIQDPTQRAAKAMEIFGKSGTQLLPLLQSDIEALRQEARDLGLSISDIDAANAEGLGDAFAKVAKTIGGIGMQIGAAVAEPLTKIANITAGLISYVSKWVAENRALVQTIAAIGAGLVVAGGVAFGLGVAIIGVGATISALGAVIGGIVATVTTVFGAVATVFGAVLSPIGLVVAAVVGLGAYITYAALSATGSLTKLSEMFSGLGGTAVEAWGGIVAALSTGDLETAGQIAFTALEVGWLTITTTMRQVWANVSTFFVNTWLSAVQSIVEIGASIYFGISKYWDLLTTAMTTGWDTAITYITGTIDSIQTAIAKALIKAQEFFGLFSADQSIQIQATLDQDLAWRQQGRQQGLDNRSLDRSLSLDDRDTARKDTAKQFSDTLAEDFKRREAKVDNSGLTDAQKRLEELKLSLTEKAAQAQAKAAQAQKDGPAKVEAAQQNLSTIKNESGGSIGTFVSGVANAIAGGGASPLEDLGKQQVDLLSSMDGRLREALVGDGED